MDTENNAHLEPAQVLCSDVRCAQEGECHYTKSPLHNPNGSLRSYVCPAVDKEIALRTAALQALSEAMSAAEKWPPFNSAHEGFAILDEERDELWTHVKVDQKRRDLPAMRQEAIQVAAMALRFVVDVCDGGRGRV